MLFSYTDHRRWGSRHDLHIGQNIDYKTDFLPSCLPWMPLHEWLYVQDNLVLWCTCMLLVQILEQARAQKCNLVAVKLIQEHIVCNKSKVIGREKQSQIMITLIIYFHYEYLLVLLSHNKYLHVHTHVICKILIMKPKLYFQVNFRNPCSQWFPPCCYTQTKHTWYNPLLVQFFCHSSRGICRWSNPAGVQRPRSWPTSSFQHRQTSLRQWGISETPERKHPLHVYLKHV